MRTFVVRAPSTPTDSQQLLEEVGKDSHTEILAHTLMNAIFVAQSHVRRGRVFVALERLTTRALSFHSNGLRDVGGFHEQALLGKVARALDASRGMGKEETRSVEPGITVRTIGFERLAKELAETRPLFVLDKKGEAIRSKPIGANPCFLLTDHLPMPKKSWNTLDRLEAEKISLGPKMLFASQCVLLIHHELDQRDP